MQTGKDNPAARAPSVEELLAQAGQGRSKYDSHAATIDQLLAGGVTQQAIIGWLAAQGVKAESGEFSRWVRRREARLARQTGRQVALAGKQAGENIQGQPAAPDPVRPVAARPPAATPASQIGQAAPALVAPQPAAWTPESTRPGGALRSPDERSGTSQAEKDLDDRVAAALEESRRTRGHRPKATPQP